MSTPDDQSIHWFPQASYTWKPSAWSQTTGGCPRMATGSYASSVWRIGMDSGTGNSVTILRNGVSTRGTRLGMRSNSLAIVFLLCQQIRWLLLADQQEYQGGGHQRDQAGSHQDGRERILVRDMTDQISRDDRAHARAGAAQTADRRYRSAGIQIRRQRQCHGGPGGIGKCRDGKQRNDRRERRHGDGWNQQGHAESADQDDEFASFQNRPAAVDEVARETAAEKVAEVGRQEWNPETQYGVFQRKSLGDQVNGEPVGDKKPDRIGERFAEHNSPGFLQSQKLT